MPSPVTVVLGSDGLVIVPKPLTFVHVPVPDTGVFPARVVDVPQTPCAGPALAGVGAVTPVMVTSLVEVQVPLVIVQRKVFGPVPRPVTVELGLEGSVIVPDPLTLLHVPVPVAGALPPRVAEVPHTLCAGPALAAVGAPDCVMTTSAVEAAQGALAMVQRKVLAPGPRSVTAEVGLVGLVMVPDPLTLVHVPVPDTGVFPASVTVVAHTVWFVPALAVVGDATPVITTSEVLGVHAPFEIVQRKVLGPTPRPVTAEVGLEGLVMVPDPLTLVHVPVPTVGAFPASVAEVPHTSWSGPASAAVRVPVWVMMTSAEDAVHGALLIVQRKTFVPAARPVTVVAGLDGLVIVPAPLTLVHVPEPVAGVFPESVAEVAHTVWLAPALAVVGLATPVMMTSEVLGVQFPLVIVHRKVLGPVPRPVTVDVALEGLVTVPAPLTLLQVPVPDTGLFPARVADVPQTLCAGPASAVVGAGMPVMVTSLVEAAQGAFPMVQRNTLAPVPSPVTVDAGLEGLVTVPAPLILVHVPVPATGVFPASVAVVPHTLWAEPALAVVGAATPVITTSLEEGAQGALLMVQRKTLSPTVRPVTAEAGPEGLAIVPDPLTLVHIPVPDAGEFPPRVAEVPQTLWAVPAFAVVGGAMPVMTTSLVDVQEPLAMVHRKVFAPVPGPVTVEAGLEGLVIFPDPLTLVQVPVPVTGVFPARVAVLPAHTLCALPALAVVGAALMVRFAPLSDPVVEGLLETTRILYPVPVVDGRATLLVIVPESAVDVSVPNVTGDANDPLALESWAVNTLPALNVPVAVYGMLIPVCPAQNGPPLIVPVVMELLTVGVHTRVMLENWEVFGKVVFTGSGPLVNEK